MTPNAVNPQTVTPHARDPQARDPQARDPHAATPHAANSQVVTPSAGPLPRRWKLLRWISTGSRSSRASIWS